jgi:nitrous oxidase accessory protein
MKTRSVLILFFFIGHYLTHANTLHVGNEFNFKKINLALKAAQANDTIMVHRGIYKEGNIMIDKSVCLIGIDKPILDGDRKFEVITIHADHVTIKGFSVQHSSYAILDDPGGIKVQESNHVVITDNELVDNFFGIYIQNSKNCLIQHNSIIAFGKEEQQIGNGIHCWKSDSLLIIHNKVNGHRDGIYFEFVTNSLIWRNISDRNIRYGLHFMFSNNDTYITNVFSRNGAGVAVMFSKAVHMYNNTFKDNWGDAAYGILLKEISDSYIEGNHFNNNTAALYLDGANRLHISKNIFSENGWALKIQANCMDNVVTKNNFTNNTFDVSTNGSLVLNYFKQNFWDKYEGYDLNRDKVGDIPFHPLSLFSVIVEKNPPVMLLFRSFMVSLLDKSEKMLPSLTPENFVDTEPLMNPNLL